MQNCTRCQTHIARWEVSNHTLRGYLCDSCVSEHIKLTEDSEFQIKLMKVDISASYKNLMKGVVD